MTFFCVALYKAHHLQNFAECLIWSTRRAYFHLNFVVS